MSEAGVPIEVTWLEVADAVWLAAVTGYTGSRSADHPPGAETAVPPIPADAIPDTTTTPSAIPPPPETAPPARLPDPDGADTMPSRPVTVIPLIEAGAGRLAGPFGPVGRAALPLRRDARAIVRAMRPLHLRIDSRQEANIVLDEEATAEQAMETGRWLPVTRPDKELWLDLTVVIDAGPSMVLWRSTVAAVNSLLEQLGTFRTIQLRLFDTDRPAGQLPRLLGGTPDTPARSPAELLDPTQRRVVLVLTDGVGACWRDNSASDVLAQWGRSMPVAMVHLLPQRLWRLGELNAQRVRLSSRGRRRPNSRWQVELLDTWLAPPPADGADPAVPIPVLEPDARWLASWARLLIGTRHEPVNATAVMAGVDSHPVQEDLGTVPPSAREQVKAFLSTASPPAFRLATLLAAVPVSLPVAKLIQAELVPDSGPEHVAEVFTSGLMRPASEPESWETGVFNVAKGVREELLSGARRSETAQVRRLVKDYFGDPETDSGAAADVAIETIVMRALSGPYLPRADRLDTVPETMAEVDDPTAESTGGAADPTSVVATRPDQTDELPEVWGNVPPHNVNFTGRMALVDLLRERLTDVGATVLHGLPGIGKTQVAVEYVYRHLRDYDLVWWIEASRPTQIRVGLTELAQRLRLPGCDEADNAIPAVLAALQAGARRWLLVYDAADDPDGVQRFLPTDGAGHVLIVSRNPDWGGIVPPLEVEPFSRRESITLLSNRDPDIDRSEADQLADALGDQPLALAQAAALRAETGLPVREYLRLYHLKVVEILESAAPADYDLPVAATWNVSFDAIRRRNPAARQILQVCAFLSPESIPRNLFNGVRGISIAPELDKALWEPTELGRAFREIDRYGLANVDHGNDTLQLHRLAQIVLRDRMTVRQQQEMRRATHRLLGNFDPNDPVSPKQWQRYQAMLPHAYASDVFASAEFGPEDSRVRQLIINLIRFLYQWGDHDEAVSVGSRVLAVCAHERGAEDPQTLELAALLGYFYWLVGRYDDAATLNLDTLAVLRRLYDEDDERTLAAQLLVSADLKARGDFVSARKLAEGVFRKELALFGLRDPVTLRAARINAINLRLCGEYRKACDLDFETYHLQAEILGRYHPNTLSTQSGLIMDRRELGDYTVAHEQQERLAEEARELFGEDATDTLRRLAYLAVTRRKAGDHEGALELSASILERIRVRQGPDNFNAMSCALAYSIDLRYAGELDHARRLGEEVVDRYRSNLGDHHPFTRCAIVDLAVTLRLLGAVEDAQRLDTESQHKLRESLGADHPYVIICAIHLASDLAARDQPQVSLALGTDALERAERVLGADHPTTLAASLNVAFDLRTLGRTEAAEERYREVLALYRQRLGPKHPAIVAAEQGLRANCDIDPLPL
ncbi:MAG TPA: FxSxx-COOH system tetratricopeptide repeat protein [Pseudonocardiaceae bacterium]|nr:FxSxx-COOH system tetratricopeptide repeat protein [Pseudonocardiaceae bacterium]